MNPLLWFALIVWLWIAIVLWLLAQGSNLVGVYSRPYEFTDEQAGGV